MKDKADQPVAPRGKSAQEVPRDPTPPPSTASNLPGRRGVIELGAIACGASVAALAVWPLGAAVLGTSEVDAHEAPWVDLAAASALAEGEPVKAFPSGQRRDGWTVAAHELSPVWLVRRGGAVQAFSAVCPHLGCLVDRRPDAPGWACPCHDSRFGPDGACLGGPSPRGLDPLPVKLEKGRVLVQILEFTTGTAARKAV